MALLDTTLDRLDTPGAPGGAIAVVQDGRLVEARGFGLADVETGAPFTPSSLFHVCSITKSFTGLLLGLLERDGLLSFEDELRDHFPDTPAYPWPLRLRHLVTNTGGLRDYFSLMAMERGRPRPDFPREDLDRHSLRQPSLMFEPGTRYSYSNSNFVALCRVMEKVTGRPYGELLAERVLGPLGMASSRFETQTQPPPPGAAIGWNADGRGGFTAPRLDVHEAGDGGLWSTAEDLTRFCIGLMPGGAWPDALVERLTTAPVLGDGAPGWYACGFGTGRRQGDRWFGHTGGLAGMSTSYAVFPDQRLAVVVGLNGPGADAEALGFSIADALRGVTAPEGRYEGVDIEATWIVRGGEVEILARDGVSTRQTLEPAADGDFVLRPSGAVLSFPPDGGLLVSAPKAEKVRFRRVS